MGKLNNLRKTDQLYKTNHHILKKRWPNLCALISSSSLPEAYTVDNSRASSTLIINGLHLSSGYDRIKEAAMQASLIPEQSPDAWLYGVGLGDLPRILLERPSLQNLYIVLMSFSVFKTSMYYTDHCHWLGDKRVRLMDSEPLKIVNHPFSVVPPLLYLADERSASIRDRVFLELSQPFISQSQIGRRESIIANLSANERFVKTDGDVTSLYNDPPSKPILIVAAGPSLTANIDWLISNHSNYFLIAVDATLKTLLKYKILPDLLITIDSYEEGTLPYFDVDLSGLGKVQMVYFPVIPPQILTGWPGPRFAAYSEQLNVSEFTKLNPKGYLYCSGTVLHAAVDLAVKMGSKMILLLGVDFGFSEQQVHVNQHAKQIYQKWEKMSMVWVLNGRGEKIKTVNNLRGYLRDLENYIACYPNVKFINISRDGAKIEGTVYLDELSGQNINSG